MLDRSGTPRGEGRIFLPDARIARLRLGFGLPIGLGCLFSVGWRSGQMCHRRIRAAFSAPVRLASVDAEFLRDVLAAHFDFALISADGGKVVGHLHSQPRLLRAAESLG